MVLMLCYNLSCSSAACGRSGEYEHALQLFTDMKNEGLQPDLVAYNAMFSALRVSHMPDEVSSL
jgi:pentatricopeptide repeat protein